MRACPTIKGHNHKHVGLSCQHTVVALLSLVQLISAQCCFPPVFSLVCLSCLDQHRVSDTVFSVSATPQQGNDQSQASSASGDSIGSNVDRLKVEVVDGVAVYVANAQYSIPRLREHYGKDLCWPPAVSNKQGEWVFSLCPCKGKPGHEPDGVLHQIDPVKKKEFHANIRHFRLSPGEPGYREPTPQKPKQGN